MIVSGWIMNKRIHGKKIFIDLRSIMPEKLLGMLLQVVVDASLIDKHYIELLKKVPRESFISLEGNIVKEQRAPSGIEIHVSKIIELSPSLETYPIHPRRKYSIDFLLDHRHLVIRDIKYQRIWIIREYFIQYLREWFINHNWIEVYPPIIVFTACEGGATLFHLDYFGQEAYLSQSAQLYLEALIYSLGKVFSLTPSFRAEKSRTRRHLTEFWHFEAEAAMYLFEDILKVQEESLCYAINKLLNNERIYQWIKEFRGSSINLLENIKPPFPRITYSDAIELLNKKGVSIKWGDDLGADEEKVLSMEFDIPFFITYYPTKIKAFYVKHLPDNEELCYSADMLAPEGYGEITTGGQREDDTNKLIARINAEGFDIENYKWYLDLRRYGSVSHSGFGLGVERALMWLLKLDHIRETIPFPRLARRKTLI